MLNSASRDSREIKAAVEAHAPPVRGEAVADGDGAVALGGRASQRQRDHVCAQRPLDDVDEFNVIFKRVEAVKKHAVSLIAHMEKEINSPVKVVKVAQDNLARVVS